MKPIPKSWMECSHAKLLLCWAGYSSHVKPITQLSLDLTVSVVVQQLHDIRTNLWKHLCFAVTLRVHLFGFFSCSTTGLPPRTKVLFFKCYHSHCSADKKFKSERACERCAAKTHMSKQRWLLCYCINHFYVGGKTPYIEKISIIRPVEHPNFEVAPPAGWWWYQVTKEFQLFQLKAECVLGCIQ